MTPISELLLFAVAEGVPGDDVQLRLRLIQGDARLQASDYRKL